MTDQATNRDGHEGPEGSCSSNKGDGQERVGFHMAIHRFICLRPGAASIYNEIYDKKKTLDSSLWRYFMGFCHKSRDFDVNWQMHY